MQEGFRTRTAIHKAHAKPPNGWRGALTTDFVVADISVGSSKKDCFLIQPEKASGSAYPVLVAFQFEKKILGPSTGSDYCVRYQINYFRNTSIL